MNVENLMGQSEGTQIRDMFKNIGIELGEFPAPGYEPPGVYRGQQVVDAFRAYDAKHPGCVDMSIITSHMTGTQIRDAFRCILKKGVAPVVVPTTPHVDKPTAPVIPPMEKPGFMLNLADWHMVPGASPGLLTKHDRDIRLMPHGALKDEIESKPVTIDPTKWYRFTVVMDPEPLSNSFDDGGDFSIADKAGGFDDLALTISWGASGLADDAFDPGTTRVLVVPPGLLGTTTRFRILAAGTDSPFDLKSIKIEVFDSDPRTP